MVRSLHVEENDPIQSQPKQRVLVVDDNEDSLMLARYILEDGNYSVKTLPSGHEVIKTAIAYRPDLILLDLALGDISGIEVFLQLKQYEPLANVPVIAVTAFAQEAIKEEAIGMGFADYVIKPYHVEDLYQVIAKYSLSAGAND
ncbi:MAG: response regulator [Phormidesmis sp.]